MSAAPCATARALRDGQGLSNPSAWSRGLQRPDVSQRRLAERIDPNLRRLRLVDIVETLARSVRMEMDFRLEAAAAAEFAESLAGDPEFHPAMIPADLAKAGPNIERAIKTYGKV